MKPIIKYPGGKSNEIKSFIDYIPKNYNRYVEPFVGGGALYFYLEPKNAWINDINGHLINFYLTVRDNFDRLKKELNLLAEIYNSNQKDFSEEMKNKEDDSFIKNKNEALYYKIRDMFNGKIDRDFTDAALYYFINKTAYSGMLRFNSKGEYNVPFGRYKKLNADIVSEAHSKLLDGAKITQQDYSVVFEECNEDDFIFLDPPYDCTFTEYGNINGNDFSHDKHIKLAQDFKNLSSKAMMIIGKTDFIEELYKPYIKGEYQKKYSVNIRNRFKAESKHLIIANY